MQKSSAYMLPRSDHAQLFIMSIWVAVIDPEHNKTAARGFLDSSFVKYFPNTDKHGAFDGPYRQACSNIYRTKDNRFFHLHGKLIFSLITRSTHPT